MSNVRTVTPVISPNHLLFILHFASITNSVSLSLSISISTTSMNYKFFCNKNDSFGKPDIAVTINIDKPTPV